jgi:hypothetical protein
MKSVILALHFDGDVAMFALPDEAAAIQQMKKEIEAHEDAPLTLPVTTVEEVDIALSEYEIPITYLILDTGTNDFACTAQL